MKVFLLKHLFPVFALIALLGGLALATDVSADSPTDAPGAARLALIIGNSGYRSVSDLGSAPVYVS